MTTEIYVCLDLGNDTLKISFAYETAQHEEYGKINVPDLLNQVAYPAAAFYDTEARKWLFADEVEAGDNKNFSTVVKIKEILSLITKQEDKAIEKRNSEYYRTGHYFPQFSFPVKRKIAKDFQYLVDNKLVFEVPACTPQKMCEDFFVYMKNQILERISVFSKMTNITFKPLKKIVIVHPPKLGINYVNELSRLIKNAFGFAPVKDITSTQALGLFALHNKLLTKDERVLLFDLGDETLSVAKVWGNEVGKNSYGGKKMGILVDIPSAHLYPLDVGGSNIDETISAQLEDSIYERETIGSPSSGEAGHIYESGLCANQYLLMKDIKKAKMLMQLSGEGMFKDGVPITVHRETLVQRTLKPSVFADCVGITGNNGVADALLQYVRQELGLAANRDVTKLLFAGGMVETSGLIDYIKKKISSEYPQLTVLTFENKVNDNHPFHIQFFETSTYAAAAGGAVVVMKDYSVDAALSYSYGTWLYNNGLKCLELFAERGDVIVQDKQRFTFESHVNLSQDGVSEIEDEEMYSTIITNKDIERRLYSTQITYDEGHVVIGDNQADPDRLRAEKAIDLKVVAGGPRTEIQFFYKNARVSLSGYDGQVVYFEEGFVVDKNGVAVPIFENLKSKNNIKINATYFDSNGRINLRNAISVSASDIEFRLNMKPIEVVTNN